MLIVVKANKTPKKGSKTGILALSFVCTVIDGVYEQIFMLLTLLEVQMLNIGNKCLRITSP